jgi:N-acetylglucosaminyl-diphospho-decaprenol L-rhamnosyltransferase
MSTAPLVSLVAINYNGAGLVERFLAGVYRSDYVQLEIIVVDNASNDDSASLFDADESVAVIRSPKNLGYGRACNLGAEQSHGELLLFMNPDVDLHTDTISALVRDLLESPGAAVVCASMQVTGFHHQRQRRVEDVASLDASTMLVEKTHFTRLGGFDPWIFLYSEDADLCYRTWLLGRRVLKSWDAVADHDVGGAGGGHRWSAEQVKNGLYVHLKLRPWRVNGRYAARMLLKTVIRGVRLRDAGILRAWTVNARELPQTLRKRHAILGAAAPEDRARLERLGAQHAYWARRSWRRSVWLTATRRLGGAFGVMERD